MIDLAPFPKPHESPEIQEAESRKYTAFLISIVPLRSGRLAMYSVRGHRRTLWAIADHADELMMLYEKQFLVAKQNAEKAEKKLAAQRERALAMEEAAKSLNLDIPELKI